MLRDCKWASSRTITRSDGLVQEGKWFMKMTRVREDKMPSSHVHGTGAPNPAVWYPGQGGCQTQQFGRDAEGGTVKTGNSRQFG